MDHPIQTRREFLRKGIFFLATGMTAPFFLTRTALALDQMRAAAPTSSLPGVPDDHILVVIQLGGGNDGLNTVVPYTMDEYYKARPMLGIGKDKIHKLSGSLGLHPGLTKFKELFDDGKLAVIQGVGYPNPDRSHFRSMEIWHTADPKSKATNYGWLGRYLDNACPGCDPRTHRINPMGGINLGGEMPLAMRSQRGASIALDNPESFKWQPLADGQADAKHASQIFQQLNHVVTANLNDPQVARLDFLSRCAMNADVSSQRIKEVTKRTHSGGSYPKTSIGNQLRIVSQLINGGVDTRVFYVSLSGFDTHANEPTTQDRLLTEVAEAVSAFQNDLEAKGNAGRVMTITFSEFGRRVAENASRGTDHGTAAPMFVIGSKIKPGIYGEHPSLTDLDHGDLKFKTDFRSVYATVLDGWLGAKPAPILGQEFERLKFI